jgi:hypothetical protein
MEELGNVCNGVSGVDLKKWKHLFSCLPRLSVNVEYTFPCIVTLVWKSIVTHFVVFLRYYLFIIDDTFFCMFQQV